MPEALAPPPPAAVPVTQQSFLALDYGTRRTGMAVGNRMLRTATALPTLRVQGEARLLQIGLQIAEWQPDALVVGVPFHPDGAEHENTVRARRFARSLRARFGRPVHEVDERYSTTEARALGARDHDTGAACVILEQFLRGLP